jgi:uncharacterized protein YciI
MPTFIAIGFDRRPKERGARDAMRPEHRAYVLDHVRPIICAGSMYDDDRSQCGSVYMFEADSLDAVHAWLRAEPFFSNGIYESMQVREIEVGPLWTLPAQTPER